MTSRISSMLDILELFFLSSRHLLTINLLLCVIRFTNPNNVFPRRNSCSEVQKRSANQLVASSSGEVTGRLE